jgi:hypothetical protein
VDAAELEVPAMCLRVAMELVCALAAAAALASADRRGGSGGFFWSAEALEGAAASAILLLDATSVDVVASIDLPLLVRPSTFLTSDLAADNKPAFGCGAFSAGIA